MFGFLKRQTTDKVPQEKTLQNVFSRGNWYGDFMRDFIVHEPFPGAWQRNLEVCHDTVLAFFAIFACTTLIASDISKMRMRVVRLSNGIWVEVPMTGYEVLNNPNGYQNRIQFFEHWLISKLTRGNTYVLKERDNRGRVARLYILSPDLVTPLVSESGDVYYQLGTDNLTGIENQITVPASEIIHDRFNCLFHPLVGLSPIFASGLAATQGLKIQHNSTRFFANMSRPSGILTAPGAISDETASRLKDHWDENYSGRHLGKVAVLGDDLKYQPIVVTAADSQMVEQLRLTAEIVCSTFHVPAYKVIGDTPSYSNIEALEQQYYNQCLQVLIESIELCLNNGLDMPAGLGTNFDLDGLLRMDSATKAESYRNLTGSGIMAPNEARRKFDLPPVEGGDAPYLQEQNYSLEALARRDAQAPDLVPADDSKEFLVEFTKGLSGNVH